MACNIPELITESGEAFSRVPFGLMPVLQLSALYTIANAETGTFFISEAGQTVDDIQLSGGVDKLLKSGH